MSQRLQVLRLNHLLIWMQCNRISRRPKKLYDSASFFKGSLSFCDTDPCTRLVFHYGDWFTYALETLTDGSCNISSWPVPSGITYRALRRQSWNFDDMVAAWAWTIIADLARYVASVLADRESIPQAVYHRRGNHYCCSDKVWSGSRTRLDSKLNEKRRRIWDARCSPLSSIHERFVGQLGSHQDTFSMG
jgi:hypothetical protein